MSTNGYVMVQCRRDLDSSMESGCGQLCVGHGLRGSTVSRLSPVNAVKRYSSLLDRSS